MAILNPIYGWGGSSGGSGGLLLNVAGGTSQPSSPSENTIWINTDQEITGWVFAIDEPENPSDGLVWFKLYGQTGQVSVNVLEENAIVIDLGRIWQYSGGAFVSRKAQVYQNGEWIPVWNGILYDNGVIPISYAGLENVNSKPSTHSLGTGTFGENAWHWSISNGKAIALCTKEKIDITGFETLHFESTGDSLRFGLATTNSPYDGSTWAASMATTEGDTLDISGVEAGEYYVLASNYKGTSGTLSGDVYKFWFE